MEKKPELSLSSELKFNDLRGIFSHIDPLFRFSVVVTFIWGFVAHGYCFANLTISDDSLEEFANSAEWKNSLGRFVEPIYHKLFRGSIALPWLAGFLALLWLSLALWVTVKLFSIKDRVLITFISGIFTTNLAVICNAATWITDLDANMFTVFLSVLAVYCWTKGRKYYWLTVFLTWCVLGTYQSFFPIVVVMIIIVCMDWLVQGEKAQTVLFRGLEAMGLLLLAGGLYILSLKLGERFFGLVLSEEYNGVSRLWEGTGVPLFRILTLTYQDWLKRFCVPDSVFSLNLVLYLFVFFWGSVFVSFLMTMRDQKLPLGNKLLLLLLVLVLPFGSNLAYALSGCYAHTLMQYALWLQYIPGLLLLRNKLKNNPGNSVQIILALVAALSLSVSLAGNVRFANTAYIKKDMERQATLSTMTKVVYDMEQLEDYEAGVTEVCFIKTMDFETIEAMKPISKLFGLTYPNQMTWKYKEYFEYILHTPICVSDTGTQEKMAEDEAVSEMPSYPEDGSIRWFDDVLVIKLGEQEWWWR